MQTVVVGTERVRSCSRHLAYASSRTPSQRAQTGSNVTLASTLSSCDLFQGVRAQPSLAIMKLLHPLYLLFMKLMATVSSGI